MLISISTIAGTQPGEGRSVIALFVEICQKQRQEVFEVLTILIFEKIRA